MNENMNEESIRLAIRNILDENGIFIDDDEKSKDLDLREYLIESLQFIYFIVQLEEQLGIEIPDDMLLYDNLASEIGFANMILQIGENSKRKEEES